MGKWENDGKMLGFHGISWFFMGFHGRLVYRDFSRKPEMLVDIPSGKFTVCYVFFFHDSGKGVSCAYFSNMCAITSLICSKLFHWKHDESRQTCQTLCPRIGYGLRLVAKIHIRNTWTFFGDQSFWRLTWIVWYHQRDDIFCSKFCSLEGTIRS